MKLSFVGNWDVLDLNRAATDGHCLQGPTSLKPAHLPINGVELASVIQNPGVHDFLFLATHKDVLRAGDQGLHPGQWFSGGI